MGCHQLVKVDKPCVSVVFFGGEGEKGQIMVGSCDGGCCFLLLVFFCVFGLVDGWLVGWLLFLLFVATFWMRIEDVFWRSFEERNSRTTFERNPFFSFWHDFLNSSSPLGSFSVAGGHLVGEDSKTPVSFGTGLQHVSSSLYKGLLESINYPRCSGKLGSEKNFRPKEQLESAPKCFFFAFAKKTSLHNFAFFEGSYV